jgi:hypothetical protein
VPCVTVSIAGLPATIAWVLVGPPLLASVVLRILAKAVGLLPLQGSAHASGQGFEPLVMINKARQQLTLLLLQECLLESGIL